MEKGPGCICQQNSRGLGGKPSRPSSSSGCSDPAGRSPARRLAPGRCRFPGWIRRMPRRSSRSLPYAFSLSPSLYLSALPKTKNAETLTLASSPFAVDIRRPEQIAATTSCARTSSTSSPTPASWDACCSPGSRILCESLQPRRRRLLRHRSSIGYSEHTVGFLVS